MMEPRNAHNVYPNPNAAEIPTLIPCSCPFKRDMGLDFTIFRKFTIFTIFRKMYFGHKPLRDKRYGDGSGTVGTGRSGRFFSVLLISILSGCSPTFCPKYVLRIIIRNMNFAGNGVGKPISGQSIPIRGQAQGLTPPRICGSHADRGRGDRGVY